MLRSWPLSAGMMALIAIILSTIPASIIETNIETPAGLSSCAVSESHRLAAAPTAIIMAPIDLGPQILLHTQHSIIGAPYIRNNHGNRNVLEFFTSDSEKALVLVQASRAQMLVHCPESPEERHYRADYPDGMAAILASGKIPNWLRLIEKTSGGLLIFEVQP